MEDPRIRIEGAAEPRNAINLRQWQVYGEVAHFCDPTQNETNAIGHKVGWFARA